MPRNFLQGPLLSLFWLPLNNNLSKWFKTADDLIISHDIYTLTEIHNYEKKVLEDLLIVWNVLSYVCEAWMLEKYESVAYYSLQKCSFGRELQALRRREKQVRQIHWLKWMKWRGSSRKSSNPVEIKTIWTRDTT